MEKKYSHFSLLFAAALSSQLLKLGSISSAFCYQMLSSGQRFSNLLLCFWFWLTTTAYNRKFAIPEVWLHLRVTDVSRLVLIHHCHCLHHRSCLEEWSNDLIVGIYKKSQKSSSCQWFIFCITFLIVAHVFERLHRGDSHEYWAKFKLRLNSWGVIIRNLKGTQIRSY